jgi:hypothetical protein
MSGDLYPQACKAIDALVSEPQKWVNLLGAMYHGADENPDHTIHIELRSPSSPLEQALNIRDKDLCDRLVDYALKKDAPGLAAIAAHYAHKPELALGYLERWAVDIRTRGPREAKACVQLLLRFADHPVYRAHLLLGQTINKTYATALHCGAFESCARLCRLPFEPSEETKQQVMATTRQYLQDLNRFGLLHGISLERKAKSYRSARDNLAKAMPTRPLLHVVYDECAAFIREHEPQLDPSLESETQKTAQHEPQHAPKHETRKLPAQDIELSMNHPLAPQPEKPAKDKSAEGPSIVLEE